MYHRSYDVGHRYQVTHQQLEQAMYTKAGLWILEFYLAQKYLRYKVKVHKVKGEQLAHKCPSHIALAKEFEMKDIEHLFDETKPEYKKRADVYQMHVDFNTPIGHDPKTTFKHQLASQR